MAHSTPKFDESILYKTRRHPLSVFSTVLSQMIFLLPVSLVIYFLSDFSWVWTISVFIVLTLAICGYQYYLWSLSWLLIGNQKVTLYVRKGIFSQYTMNIRYRNIRDCACSKNNFFSYLFKYGTFFARSNGGDGDFQATYVPKVGKIYALVNALTRYSDDDRENIKTIEALHTHHVTKEFPINHESLVEKNTNILLSLPGITAVVSLDQKDRDFIHSHEEARNHGIYEVIKRTNVLCFTHDHLFRPAS
jgi:hypothetical protein